jgi:hypothetical protein
MLSVNTNVKKAMKFISTKTHGYLDYIYGVFLLISPWVFGFAIAAEGTADTMIPVILGAGTIAFSLLTDYELGMYNLISVRGHLMIDMLMGVFLAASPWLFQFAGEVWFPHVVFGIIAIVVSMCTTTKRSSRQSPRDHHAAIFERR